MPLRMAVVSPVVMRAEGQMAIDGEAEERRALRQFVDALIRIPAIVSSWRGDFGTRSSPNHIKLLIINKIRLHR